MKFLSRFFNFSSDKNKNITLDISSSLEEFVKAELLPGLDISQNYFWSSF